MFRNIIESYTGYAQIQHEDFKDNPSIDNIFEYKPEIEEILFRNSNVASAVPRFESFALASGGNLTKGVLVMGIDPVKESALSNVRGRLVKYRLTPSVVDTLKKSAIPEKVKEKLDLLMAIPMLQHP